MYTDPLEIFRKKIIKRNKNFISDAFGFVSFSRVICMSLFLLISSTSIVYVIGELSFLKLLPIPEEIEESILSDDLENAKTIHVFVISYIEPLMIFLARNLHHSLSTEEEKRYPGHL